MSYAIETVSNLEKLNSLTMGSVKKYFFVIYENQVWYEDYKVLGVNRKQITNIVIVKSEYDRMHNITLVNNKYYYCMETNVLWFFGVNHQWTVIAGEPLTKGYSEDGFAGGSFVFTNETTTTGVSEATVSGSPFYVKFYRVGYLIRVSIDGGTLLNANGEDNHYLCRIPEGFRPFQSTSSTQQIKKQFLMTGIDLNGNTISRVMNLTTDEYLQFAEKTDYQDAEANGLPRYFQGWFFMN